MRRYVLALAAAAASGVLTLTGCTSETPPDRTNSLPTVPAPLGSDPATWAPVEIDTRTSQAGPVILIPGQRAIFTGLTDVQYYLVVSQDEAVVKAVQPSASGDTVTGPGLIAVAAGESTVQLELDGAMVYEPVLIRVVPDGMVSTP